MINDTILHGTLSRFVGPICFCDDVIFGRCSTITLCPLATESLPKVVRFSQLYAAFLAAFAIRI